MQLQVTKTYGHSEGLSVVFRQHRADSHCRLLHGYALRVKLTIEAQRLDARHWVFDFGGLKPVKAWLHDNFDHTLLVAEDDPERDQLCALAGLGLADVTVVPAIGCEAFCTMVADFAGPLIKQESDGRAWLAAVEVAEHDGNSAVAKFNRGMW